MTKIAQQIMEAYSVARQYNLMPPTMEQPQYNMFHRERVEVEYSRLYTEIGMGTTIWSPLASGLLTGKYNNVVPDDTRINRPGMDWLKESMTGELAKPKIEIAKQLGNLAQEIGTNLPRLALAWCLKNPNVSTVITGASKLEQLVDNIQAIEVVEKITPEIAEKIEAILGNKPKQPAF